MIKAVLEGPAGSKAFERFRATGVFGDYTAASLRVGVVNFLTSYMSAEFVAYLTGHQLTGIGALFEYLRVEVRLPLELLYHEHTQTPLACLLCIPADFQAHARRNCPLWISSASMGPNGSWA